VWVFGSVGGVVVVCCVSVGIAAGSVPVVWSACCR